MAITAQQVKDLREQTGAGMMDCKKALTECDGDVEKAIDYLREKGLAKAAKKQSRIAAEGIVGSFIWGDANGDGLINNKDIVRLKNYLANLDEKTGDSSNGTTVYTLAQGGDANGDEKIDNKDIVRLKNYLVNLDKTGYSSVILGPDSGPK